ncbi:hypothetical protein MICAE_870003 [Microcystis aeruginosa PCC 9806]|uniref:Uncharacterized protein n=2 Tax=Microcystis TaxID=1125 RepID=A0A552LZK8_9CHRO|nr:hypothetical protein [Microcystis aeruginosa]TRV25651.1 MAG: hypothetical protein EWV40_04520 [Microcystis flos-aquae Mf_WU_F_19750830_S460]CCI16437.1 hypothetical protein MICAE_870003 [Microcystis aeruginosa PCC 9806]
MKNMRDVARKSGFSDSVISIRELGRSLDMVPPISLTELSHRPAVIVYDTGFIIASTVSGRVQLAIVSDGEWSFRGELSDQATLVGDKFEMEMKLNFVDSKGNYKSVTQTGELGSQVVGDSRKFSWQQNGIDPFIRDNWDNIRANGYSGRLTVHDSPAQVFALVGLGIFVGMAVPLVIAMASGKGHWERGDNENQIKYVIPRDENKGQPPLP